MLAERILAGDIRALARAATAIENHTPEAIALLKVLFPRTGNAAIFGITGSPGSGKSTIVDQMARVMRAEDRSVAIIAVDPSSPFTGGAILGDRIRMQQHHADPGVFIRSMATRGNLGGLARTTLDMALLMDAAGRQDILVETVGVGQDEIEIARLADVCAVVLVPGMGDGVQALKAGIMEIADVFVINKADLPGASDLEREIKGMLALSPPSDFEPPIVMTIASEGKGIEDALRAMRAVRQCKRRNPEQLWTIRLREMLRERLLSLIPETEIHRAAIDVARRCTDPYAAIEILLKRRFDPSQIGRP